jgi:Zn-dependent M28 family amino/carboxypeptidase
MSRSLIVLLASLAASAVAAVDAVTAEPATAPPAITAARLMDYTRQLSGDDFEGRSPGTQGETVTIGYLVRQFKTLGLAPGNPNGSFLQTVPMTAFSTKPQLSVSVAGTSIDLHSPEDFVAWSSARKRHFHLERSPLVFVGYGVQAPEYRWDDYKGVDLHGKTIIVLINDPPIPDPAHPGELDPTMFGGKAMTYYGRWTYKFEAAARLGAAAAIIVHETGPAAYPYSVVVNSWGGENYSLARHGTDPDFPLIAGWMTLERAHELFARSGLDFDALKQQALSRDFRPVTLSATASFDVHNSWRDLLSHNVLARIPGSDPQHAGETVIYSAHWDHFGWNPKLPGDKSAQVFHGAQDNASGTAALLVLAEAFHAGSPPPRSLLFIATTGEERGLLGARYYARHPLYALRDTVADINMDGINPLGPTRDVRVTSWGHSQLDQLVNVQAQRQGRTALAEAHPERGSFYRADQLEFARVGVPVIYLGGGFDFVDQSADYGETKSAEFIARRYHQVGDVIQPDWTFSGGARDVQLLWQLGDALARGNEFPKWNAGSEFRARRIAQRGGE